MKRVYSTFSLLLSLAIFLSAGSLADAEQFAQREILPNGITLLYSERKALPMVTVVVAIKAGTVVEPAEKAGLANLTADLLNEGTLKRSSQEISDEIEFVGGSLTTSGGDDYITVVLSVLKKDRALGFDLLSDIIRNPSFSPDEIERRKKIIKNYILRKNEDPGTVASMVFLKAVYGEHPYGRPVEGTEETLDGITRQDIIDFHRTYYAPNNTIMAVVGDMDKRELDSFMNTYFADWQQKETGSTPPPAPQFDKGKEVVTINKNITQANIILGHLGIKRANPDYYAVSVMNYILGGGGFASRLMDNIRDNRGISYDVHSFFSAKKYAGSFQAGLQTNNQSANTAIREILREMERIRKEPVSEGEINDARSFLTGSFPLRIDTSSEIAGFLIAVEFYDLGLDYIHMYKKLINGVSKEDVLMAAQKYLAPENSILVVVGDIEKTGLIYKNP